MYAITRQENEQTQYYRAVTRLFGNTFALSDTEWKKRTSAWKDWVASKQTQSNDDLIKLLGEEVHEVFKARAIAILIRPRKGYASFLWNDDFVNSHDSSGCRYFNLSELSPRLRQFALALLEMNIKLALEPEPDEDLRIAMQYYNGYILQILTMFPENDPFAERMFGYYQMRDLTRDRNRTFVRDPFLKMMRSEIPEKWKRLSDEKIRKLIRAKHENADKQRSECESISLGWYVREILFGYCELYPCNKALTLKYGQEMFASQMEFMLSLPNAERRNYFEGTWEDWFLKKLEGDRYKELRHRFLRHVLLANEEPVPYICNLEEITAAVTQEFPDDMELSEQLRKINEHNQTVREDIRARDSTQKQRNSKIMARMQ